MKLRRGTDTPTVAGEVVVEGTEFLLGDEVRGRVSLRGLPPQTQGTAKLGQLRQFESATGGVDFESGGAGNQSLGSSDFFTVASAPISSDASGAVEQAFTFTIPRDAPPSSVMGIDWLVVADLEAEDAYIESQTFAVLAQREAFLSMLGLKGDRSPEDMVVSPEVELDVGERCFRCGETLSGRLLVTPEKDLKARKLTARLEAEFGPYTPTDRLWDFDQTLELGKNVELEAGRRHEFPFTFEIPDDAPPTIWEDPQARSEWLDRSYDDDELCPTTRWTLTGSMQKGRVFGLEDTHTRIHLYNAP
jgi:hypothetical protein